MRLTKIISGSVRYIKAIQSDIEKWEALGYEVVDTHSSSSMASLAYAKLETNITVIMQINI